MHFCFIKGNIFPSPDWNRSSYSINVGGKNAFDILHHVSEYENNIQDTDQQFLESLHCEKKWEAIARRTVGRNVNNPPKIKFKKSLNWQIILVPATVWQREYQIENTEIDLGFSETWQNFSSFRELFFIVSKGIPKEKKLNNQCKVWQFFSIFPFVSPWKLQKKMSKRAEILWHFRKL